ncbi:serine/threonine protein kinase [bacterium]|nr:serine/threonine protein kinase [bacterium]
MANHPAQIGKYRIISQIGKGGMGAVYKAEHPTLKKTVIIKKLTLTGSRDFVERFRREAQLMMEFRNEKIVQVYDHFKEGNSYHIVMEYVDGITLEQLIESKRFLSEEAALLIFAEVCRALKYAHDHQIIHRDIKPANILISNSGVVKLVDFGVSASLDSSEEDSLTKAGMTIGTPSYLAPEQIANAKNRDKRSDIYSMGVLLYEMVIGKKPFRGGFSPEVISLIEKGKYVLPRKINPKIKPGMQRIIRKTMHHKVQKRYQDLGLVIKKTSKYLRKYKSQEEITAAIKAYLEGNESPFKKTGQGILLSFSSKILGVLIIGFLFAVTLGTLGFLALERGYQYEWLYPDEYGALQVMVKVRKGVKEAGENYIKAYLYSEENNSLNYEKDANLEFSEVKELETNDYYALKSPKIYLRERLYKLVLYVENEQYRENFYLYPRQFQKRNLDSSESQRISFIVDKEQPQLPVSTEYSVYDIITGESITQETDVTVFFNGEWLNWSDISRSPSPEKGFYSGKRYRTRFRHSDYFTKIYNLTVQPEQTRVVVKISLIPIPGTVAVRSEIDGVDLYLDGSLQYLDGSLNRRSKKLTPLTSLATKLELSPGEYLFSVKSGNLLGRSTAEKKIVIQSRDEFHFVIEKKADSNELLFNIE